MSSGKKIIHNSSNSIQNKNIKFIIPQNLLSVVPLDTWRNGYRCWFLELLR